MPQINRTESERIEKRKNRILYADFLTLQNDYTNGLAPAPPVLKSRYGLYNELILGRLETTPVEQVERLVVLIPPPPAFSSSSISPSATDTSITLTLPVTTAVTSYTYVLSDSSGNPLVPQPTVTGDAATTGQVTFSPLLPGREYTIIITATGPSGTSVSPPLPIYTLPTAPSGFSVSGPTTGGATLSWSGGSGATDYEYVIRDSTNNVVTGYTVIDNGDSGPATFTGLNPGSQYTITVIPRNPSGIPSSPPATFPITTAPAAPPAPTSSGSTPNGFSIPLPSTPGATGTPPYRYTVDGVPITTTSSPISYAVIGNDVVFTGVTPPGSREVRVISVSAAGVESPGTPATIHTKPIAPLSNTFSSVSTSPSAFTLNWTGNTGASSYSYIIKANDVQIANPTIVNNGASGNAIFSGLSAGVRYTVQVIVTNPAGSATSSAFTAYTAPNAAAGITQTAGTETSVSLAWTDGAGATSYVYSIKDASQNIVGGAIATTATSLLAATVTGLTAGNIYSVVITSIGASGSTPSSQAIFYTAPSKPTGLYQPASTTTSITMAWYNGVGATSYVYTLGANTTVPSSDFGVSSQTAIFTGLTPGQTYTPITVTAQRIVSATLTLSTASDNYTTGGTSPAAPTFPGSPVSGLTSTGFTLSWNPGSGAGAYTYSLSLTPGGPSVLGAAPGPRVASSTANSVTFTGLTPGTQYYPSITAAISGVPGTSTSSPSPVTTTAGPPAPAPTNNPLSTITSRGITVAFTPVAGMTYSYKVDGNAAAAITSLTPPATTPSYFLTPNPLVAGQPATVQFTGMTSGAAHTVSITATDSGGVSSAPYTYPSTGTFNTLAPPAAPTATAAATSTQTSVTLTLPTPPAGITYSYSVSGGSPSAVLSPQPVPTISSGTYTFGGLTAGTAYTVAVTATDAAGSASTYTSPSITTKSPPPSPPTAATTPLTSITSKGFTVNWNSVTGATSYIVSINSGGTSAQGLDTSVTLTSQSFTALTPGTTYTVQVKSVGAGGTSTTFLSFTPKTLDAPTAITVTTSAITATGFTVNWTGGTSPVTTNTITYSTVATPTPGTAVTKTGASPQAFTGLTSNTTYSIVVTATDPAGTTSTSTAVTAKTLSNLPAAPVLTLSTNNYNTSYEIRCPSVKPGSNVTYNVTTIDLSGNVTSTNVLQSYILTTIANPVNINIQMTTGTVYSTSVTATVAGVTSLPSNTITLLVSGLNTKVARAGLPSLTAPNFSIKALRFSAVVRGESEHILYCLFNYIDNSFTLLGNAIYSYNIITGVFVKIYDFYSTTNSYLTLIFYNMKLYTCDSTKKIIVIDIASKIASTYTTLPENTRNLNIDSSGNMMFICNRNVYTINLQNNLNSFPTITVADSIYTIPSTTPNGRDGVAIDSSGNIYYATISELRKVNKINGVYQATVSLGTGSYISDIKSFSDGIYLIEGKKVRKFLYSSTSFTGILLDTMYSGYDYGTVRGVAFGYSNTIVYYLTEGGIFSYRTGV